MENSIQNSNKKLNIWIIVTTVFIVVILLLFSFDFIPSPKQSHGVSSSQLVTVDTIDDNVAVTEYLDSEGNLTFASDKNYAFVRKIRNDAGQTVEEYYFDEYGNPAKQAAGHYGLRREYNQFGQNYKVTFVDAAGSPIMNTSGYSTLIRTYNDNNQAILEMYYGLDGEQAELTSGYYGAAYEYDADGHQVKVTFTDKNGRPTTIKSGYCSLRRTFNEDGSINTEFYLDINDEPVKVNGCYGIKRVGERRVCVDRNGNFMLTFSYVTQNFQWIIVLIGIALTIVITLLPRRLKIAAICIYIVFILLQTILMRESGGTLELTPFWSYRQFFSSYTMRLEIIDNILLFMPLGAGLYSLVRKYRIILVPFVISIVIEALQYFFRLGLCELDDVISNTLGAALGIVMVLGLTEIKKGLSLRKDLKPEA